MTKVPCAPCFGGAHDACWKQPCCCYQQPRYIESRRAQYRARQRALLRLREEHPDEYRLFLAEERDAEDLPPAREYTRHVLSGEEELRRMYGV